MLRSHTFNPNVVHKGIKKFKCEICDRRFAERCKFIKHSCVSKKDDDEQNNKNESIEEVHNEPTQENKNQCNTCGKILPGISELIQHIKEVHLKMEV